MKTPLTSFLSLFLISLAFIVQGQTSDTALARVEIDSLIQLNLSLLKEKNTDEALKVIEQAEEKCRTAFGAESAFYATVEYCIAETYHIQGDYSTAISFHNRSIAKREKALGKLNLDYAASLNRLGVLYWRLGKYADAEPLWLEAKTIREKLTGREHPLYAASLNNLAILYSRMGQYEKVEALYLEAIAITEIALGKDHPDHGRNLMNLASHYYIMGDYEKSETLYLETKRITEKAYGKDHPDHARSLENLARVYFKMGDYNQAESMWLEEKTIIENSYGKDHKQYGSSLGNLARLYKKIGDYEKSEKLYIESKTITEKAYGKEHPKYGTSLNNIALLYADMGDYEKAEAFFIEANDIYENALGKGHRNYALNLNSLADLYLTMGNYEKSEPLFLETNTLLKKVLGENHPDYAASLNHLAQLYLNVGEYKKAEPLFLEATLILEKKFGKDHPSYASSLGDLAYLYLEIEDYEKAEPLFLESIKILENKFGKDHPKYASGISSLAFLYSNKGNYKISERLFLESKAVLEKIVGNNHPDYSKNLSGLGDLYWQNGEPEKAGQFYLEENEIEKGLLTTAFRHLSEKELLRYTYKFTNGQNKFYSIAQAQAGLSESAFDNTLFYKGFLLNATRQVSRLAQTDTSSMEIFQQLKTFNRRLATEYTKPLDERKGVPELEEKTNNLEKELARSVAGFGEALRQVNWQEVQNELNEGDAAIEFVHYRYTNPKPTDSIMYAAIILQNSGAPKFIRLFEEKSLDSLFVPHQERRADYVNDLYSFNDRGLTVNEEPTRSLYELIWQPLEKELENIHTIYCSPTGLLHRINLNAIPKDDDKTISDLYNLIQLQSTRSLVVGTKDELNNQFAALYGGIQYESDSVAIATANESLEEEVFASRGVESTTSMGKAIFGGKWNYLKWTHKEIESIHLILEANDFNITLLTEYAATEESFQALGQKEGSPRILHIATHGFFFPDITHQSLDEGEPGLEEPVFKTSNNPMIRSGLIMAGGNHVWQGHASLANMEDGILTAYEISQMDLSNTELVVLSACETGLGDIEGNEGVYGLQRAFKIAGAKYLIMSLWQVPDRQTKDFMVTFYQHWLEDKMTIPDAFRKTQQEMQERFYDPYMWAGFVLVE